MKFALCSIAAVAVLCAFPACEKHPLPDNAGVKSVSEAAGKAHAPAAGDAHGQAPAGHVEKPAAPAAPGEAKH